MCIYVFIWAICEKHEIMMIAPMLYAWNASGNMYVCMMSFLKPYDDIAWYVVQMYDYEKWWNVKYMKNDENAKHAKMMIYCMLHSKEKYEKRMNWCIEHWHMIKGLINCIL